MNSEGFDRRAPRIAVLGGGQLGRMLGLAGVAMGARFRFLDPVATAPARAVGRLVVGGLDDERLLREVAEGADVVTYEWEGVPADAVRFLRAQGSVVRPGDRSLEVAQDRLVEKERFRALGIATPQFAAVDSRADLGAAIDIVGFPAVLKTRRGGYDGKGQFVVEAERDVDAAWAALGGMPLILEAVVTFDRELSVLAVRALDGEVRCWPLVENHHEGGILRLSRAPAPGASAATQARGEAIARAVLDDVDHVGVLTVELFDVGGELLANELAPRVHNSGHWTIEGAATSQFENHLRAVLGLPLGSTSARGESALLNCIGTMPDARAVLSVPGAHLHDYGKDPRPRRKLGHISVIGDSEAELRARLEALTAALVDGSNLTSNERQELWKA